MTPSIGRTVRYHLPEHEPDVNGAREFPAVVVQVWSEDCVNLRVLLDSEETPSVTSVVRSDDGAPGTWSWPTLD